MEGIRVWGLWLIVVRASGRQALFWGSGLWVCGFRVQGFRVHALGKGLRAVRSRV